MRKLAAVSVSALMIALLMGLVAAPASAKKYPPKKPTCGVSDSSISAGDVITITGKGWQAGSTVTFTLQPEGINLGSATVGANHKFTATVTIPANIGPGAHTIVCSGISVKGNEISASSPIQVLGGAVSAGGTAFTGSTLNVPLWAALVAGLLAIGVALLMLSRRRRNKVGTG